MNFIKTIILILTILSFHLSPRPASAIEIILDRVEPGKVVSRSFMLAQDNIINIKGVCANFNEDDKSLMFYAWILKSDTREVVWSLLNKENNRLSNPIFGIYDFNDELNLKNGEYEIYFTGMYNFTRKKSPDIEDYFKSAPPSNPTRYDRKFLKDLYISISSPNSHIREIPVENIISKLTLNSIASFNRVQNKSKLEKSFHLNSPSKFNIYAIGEVLNNELFDYAYITDLRSRKRIWQMDYNKAVHAGGGDKNILVTDELFLQPGDYRIVYQTDDSHAFNEWNVMPPDDPNFWGITVWAATPSDLANVTEYNNVTGIVPLAELTQVKNDQAVMKYFIVNKPVRVNIMCTGEFTFSSPADYGYILNAETGETVWTMESDKSEPAGGDSKNKVQYDQILLPAGKYLVSYITDDSHAFSQWNAAPPEDSNSWGIVLWLNDEKDRTSVQMLDEENVSLYSSLPGSIAEIIKVTDGSEITRSFSMGNDGYVRVYAIGEGFENDMYDYGWIENEYGEIIWEMSYNKTTHAGGADKNRLINEKIFLKKGTYRLFYAADDSHSYKNWNTSPPFDQERYGISILEK